MSVALLQNIGTFLDDNGLLDGYTLRYFRYSVTDLASNVPFILIRKSGNGIMNTAVQNIDFTITAVCESNGQVAASNRLHDIEVLLRGASKPVGVVQTKVLMSASDPLPLENDLYYLTMTVRMTAQDY